MHRKHVGDCEAVTSGNAGCARHGHRLEAVVHVQTLRGRRGRSNGPRNLVVQSSVTSVDGDAGTSSSSDTVGVVELEGVEARNLADVGPVISGQRLALKRLTASEVARHAVVVAGGQRQVTRIEVHALLVEDGFALGDIIKTRGCGQTLHNERALRGGHVHHSHVDVGRELLLGRITEALFLKRVTQFSRRHDPRHRLVEPDCRGNRKLGVVEEVRGHISARVRAADIRLRPPDRVVGALHHRLIRGVDRDVAGQDKGVLKTFKEVFKGYPFFFTKCISHILGLVF